MNKYEIDQLNKDMEAFTKELMKDSAKAKKFLMDVGVYDEHGDLTPEYGGKPKKRILVLEDDADRIYFFRTKFFAEEKDVSVTYCANVRNANLHVKVAYDTGKPFDIFFLDHDLGDIKQATGYDFVKFLMEKRIPYEHVIVHSGNSVGAERMLQCLNDPLKSDYIPIYKLVDHKFGDYKPHLIKE